MDVAELLAELGGVATRAVLIEASSRASVDKALRAGEVVALGPGRYSLPTADEAVRAAHRLSGVLSRESAALHHGWAVKTVPDAPHVSVPTNRKVSTQRRGRVNLHRDDLHRDDIDGISTSREYTLGQCMRTLAWDSALAVADSALRAGEPPSLLRRVAASARGPGSRQARRVAQEASADAANPFESVLRAIALDVEVLNVRPQKIIIGRRSTARPDLVDEDLRIVLEADSFEWHGDRRALAGDARRYNLLVVDGWVVLRFAWEHVMSNQAYVRDVLSDAVSLVTGRTQSPTSAMRSA